MKYLYFLKLAALRWLLVALCLMLPIIPAYSYLNMINDMDTLGSGFIIYLFVWLMLGAVNIVIFRYREKQQVIGNIRPIYIAYLFFSCVPALLSGVWIYSSPYKLWNIFRIFAVFCLLPLLFNLIWEMVLEKFRWKELILPVLTTVLIVLLFEVSSGFFLITNKLEKHPDDLSVNSPDRSYYYTIRKILPDGTNLANSYGFYGPEPDLTNTGIRVLVVGDSMPAAGRKTNFSNVAQRLLDDDKEFKVNVEIVNASISGYSLEQIYRFYNEKLEGLKHDYVIVSFYIDDINRELNYSKNNIRYTPSWPEWMQDVYWNCLLCKTLLNLFNFRDKTFLNYRRLDNYEDAFPTALTILEEIQVTADKRGARVAIYNIPRFKWPNNLPEIAQYEYAMMNLKLEEWCRDRKVAYRDTLPLLVGKDIRVWSTSDDKYHFNDAGHKLVGADLKEFIKLLLTPGELSMKN